MNCDMQCIYNRLWSMIYLIDYDRKTVQQLVYLFSIKIRIIIIFNSAGKKRVFVDVKIFIMLNNI